MDLNLKARLILPRIAAAMAAATLLMAGCVPAEEDLFHDHGGPAELADQITRMQVRTLLRLMPDPADLRPEARLILEQMLRDGLYEAPPNLSSLLFTTPPKTIKLWLRSKGGSKSCDGPLVTLSMEDYVKGVLPHEWISSWHKESLRAGAVAIRSYASNWVVKGGKYTCADLCDTTYSQVYKPATKPVTNQAVDDTKQQVMLKGGALANTEYSAENSTYPTWYNVKVDDTATCAGKKKYGHGRGMCQWGSQRWALKGKSYSWIVSHYYPGGTLWKPSTPKPDSKPWPKPDTKPWPKPDSKPWPKPDTKPWPKKDGGPPIKPDQKLPPRKDAKVSPRTDLHNAAANLTYNTLSGGCAVAGSGMRNTPVVMLMLLGIWAVRRRRQR